MCLGFDCQQFQYSDGVCVACFSRRESPTLMMHECRGFEVPEWMRVKIKESMQAMRSDGPKRSRSRSPLTVSTGAELS